MKLFNELEFEYFTQIAINKAIEEVNKADILHTNLKNKAEKIINSLIFTVPVIEKDKIVSSLSIENNEGKIYTDNFVALENNDFFATATYTIPYKGNLEIFRVKPIHSEFHEQEFILGNTELKFKLRTDTENIDISEEWKVNLIKSSLEIINFIEYNLQNLSINFNAFKNEIIGPVMHSLKLRKEALLKANSNAIEINVFNKEN